MGGGCRARQAACISSGGSAPELLGHLNGGDGRLLLGDRRPPAGAAEAPPLPGRGGSGAVGGGGGQLRQQRRWQPEGGQGPL